MSCVFECGRCGHCCSRILVDPYKNGVLHGLILFEDEIELFAEFPGAVQPYMAMQKSRGKPDRVIVCYQMVQEPCPLWDAVAKTCTQYEERPATCKAYPFSGMFGGGCSVEATCEWYKMADLVFGVTQIVLGEVQCQANEVIDLFFDNLNNEMRRTGYTNLMEFDPELRKWSRLAVVPEPEPVSEDVQAGCQKRPKDERTLGEF